MENRLTIEKEITFGVGAREKQRQTVAKVKPQEEARVKPQKEARAQMESRLTTTEKITFSIAAVFSTAILVVCVILTMIGFIFSPIADTLLFGILAAATGTTSYVIWRGGRRSVG
jgi:hypothetical protein